MSEPLPKNVVSIEDYEQTLRSAQGGPGAKALEGAARLVSDGLQSLLERMLDRVDDALFERAEKAESNMLQTRYFDAMRELRIIRRDISSDFKSLFKSRFNSGIPREQRNTGLALDWDSDASGMGLLATDELEEELAVTNMVNKLRGSCKQSLYALDRRIGFLLRDPDLERWQNPLGPEAICHAFREAIRRIESGIEIRLIIFKLFDQYVAGHMDALYREVNQHLAMMGVLPEIRVSLRKSLSPPDGHAPNRPWLSPDATPPTRPDVMTTPMAAGIIPCYRNAPQVPDAASVPMAAGIESCHQPLRRYPEAASVARATGIQSGDTGEGSLQSSIGTLTLLQHGEMAAAQLATLPIDPAAVLSGHQNILHVIKQSALIRNMGQTGDVTIGIVAMLFDYVLEDKNIPHAMRALIGRLQIPVLKVALVDNDFFSRKTHPTRLLLNRLASTAIAWNEQAGENDPVYRQVERTVQTIVDQFENDVALFATLLDELESFLQEKEREAALRAERSAKVMEGQERLEVAESTTAEEIEPRLSKADNLDFVREFVATHWKNLLFTTCARQGKDSEAWNNAVRTMDELIWSVKPKRTREERQKLVQIQPRLLDSLRQGMERLSVPATERDDFIAQLVRAHGRTAVIGDGAGQRAASAQQPAGSKGAQKTSRARKQPGITSEAKAEKETAARAVNDQHSAVAQQLPVGTWLEFRGSNGLGERAKLSWISPITGTLLFTDREGRKAGNYSVDQLAQLLRCGRARVFNTAPFMERAVGKALEEYKHH